MTDARPASLLAFTLQPRIGKFVLGFCEKLASWAGP